VRKLSHVHAQNVATLKGAGMRLNCSSYRVSQYWQNRLLTAAAYTPRTWSSTCVQRYGLACIVLVCFISVHVSFWDAYLIESSPSLTAHGSRRVSVTSCCPVTSREGAMDRGGFPRSVKRLVSDGIGSPDRPEWHAFAGNSKLIVTRHVFRDSPTQLQLARR
jgi:hypothetical protein